MTELNELLIEAVKEKLPEGQNLAHTLSDLLYLGKEAIYRRLRGEVPFTLTEAAILSQKMGVSLDKLISSSQERSALFNLNMTQDANPMESYTHILNKYTALFKVLSSDPESELCTSSNVLPQTVYLRYELLSKFRLFKWMYQNAKVAGTGCFEELKIPAELAGAKKEFVKASQLLHSTNYILDEKAFTNIINDIQYFVDAHLLTPDEKKAIKEELLVLVDDLYNIARNGRFESGKEVKIYISSVNFEATYSYLRASQYCLSMIRIYAINAITTQDLEVFGNLKEWIQSLKKFSTLISESGEMQRILFFKRQRELISAM